MEGGTGVYYQAMPAVGPDGKNVMKLIPVQKVNGHFYQTMFNAERDNVEDVQLKVHSESPSVVCSSQTQTRLPSLQPTADGRYVLKTPTQDRTLFNSAKHGGITEPYKTPKQVPLAKTNHSQNVRELPPQTYGTTAAVQKLPVTVKSPVLPNGHCLQIPPNAQVRTVPASALPQSIKNRIMNSVSSSSMNQKVHPTVVLVSPVNSVKLNSEQQSISLTKPSQIQKSLFLNLPANTGASSPVGSPVNSKPVEEVSTPFKWVVQEEMGASGPFLVPVSSTQVNPIGNNAARPTSKPPPPPVSQEKVTPCKDNALVMCNGKVYFVAKKNSEIVKDVMVSEGGKKGFVCISPALPASSALGLNSPKKAETKTAATKEQNLKTNVSEIIDLCDDDEASSTSLGGAPGNLPTQSQTEVDESSEDSNVIFVSYIPPKSATPAGEKDTNCASWNKNNDTAPTEKGKEAESASQSEREETTHAEMEVDVGQENTAANESGDQRDVEEQVKEPDPAERNLSSPFEKMHVEGEKQLESKIPQITMLGDTGYSHDGEADVGTVSGRDGGLEQLHNVCVQATDNTGENYENTSLNQGNQLNSDCQLRKAFGINSDVQICLQRIKETAKADPQAERLMINKRTLDGLRKVIQESQLQSRIQKMIHIPHKKTEDDEGLMEVKRKKLEHNEKDVRQDNPSLSTAKNSPVSQCNDSKSRNASFFPMENNLFSQACQEEICSSSQNTGEVAESTANKVLMQYEAPTEFSGDTHCLTPEPNVPQTTSQTISPSSALRKTPARLKKGKVCTACPCGTLLGVTEATSLLRPQGTPPAVVEPHKAISSCLHRTQGESCQPVGDCSPVRKARTKRSSSGAYKKKASSKKSTSEASPSISPLGGSVNDTMSINAASSSLQVSNGTLLNSHTLAETPEQDTSQVQTASNETSVPCSGESQGSSIHELPNQDFYSMEILDAEEIKRQERIQRLKDLLKEKEAALERMRRSMNV